MRIFIWVNCGDVDVYKAETLDDLIELFNILSSNLEIFGLQDKIGVIQDAIDYNKYESGKVLEKDIIDLLRTVTGTDEFDYGTKFSILK